MRGALLTYSNPKTAKSEGLGYLTAVMHLAPAKLSGRNVCPHATAGCVAGCLNTAGRGGIALDAEGLNDIQRARIARTHRFQDDRAAFLMDLVREIESHVRRAERHGLSPAVRLNGTSDLPWEHFPVARAGEVFANVFDAFPGVRFYDYTKWPIRLRKVDGIANYSLTFSLAETDKSEVLAREALASGTSVAVVFSTRKGRPLPSVFLGAPVVDGDTHDLRFMDPAGSVVGLRAKGRAKRDASGFVRQVETGDVVGELIAA